MFTTYAYRKDVSLNITPFGLEYEFDGEEFVYEYDPTIEDLAEYALIKIGIDGPMRTPDYYDFIASLYELGWFDKLLEDESWRDGFNHYLRCKEREEARKAYEEENQ